MSEGARPSTRTINLFNGQTLEVDAETADRHKRLVAVCDAFIENRRAAHAAWHRGLEKLTEILSRRPLEDLVPLQTEQTAPADSDRDSWDL